MAAPNVVVVVKPGAAFDVAAYKKRIASSAAKAIKKSAHNRHKKPWTELSESLPDVVAARPL